MTLRHTASMVLTCFLKQFHTVCLPFGRGKWTRVPRSFLIHWQRKRELGSAGSFRRNREVSVMRLQDKTSGEGRAGAQPLRAGACDKGLEEVC